MVNKIIDGEILDNENNNSADGVKIYENDNEYENNNKDDDSDAVDITTGVIDGELIDNNWFLASVNGDIKYLEENAKDNVGKIDTNGYTALMYSADSGHLECVKFLASFKEEIKKQDNDGNTALIYATKKGYADAVKILVKLEGGIKNKENKTALDYAIENNDEVCIKILQDVESSEDKKNKEDIKNQLKEENKKLKTELKRVEKANNEMSKVAEIEQTELNDIESAGNEFSRPVERENTI